jgi:hypothetical protein
MALSNVAAVRLLVQDNNVGFYFVTDDEIDFFLERNEQNVNRTALEVAKVILLQLSLRSTNEAVDIFSISGGSKAAESWRMSLELFLKSSQLNPALSSATGYAGGISYTDWAANVNTVDNIIVTTPLDPYVTYTTLDI